MMWRLAVAIAAIVLSLTAAQTQPPVPKPAPEQGQARCPDLSADPTKGRISLREGFLPDPQRVVVNAGGSIDISQCRTNFKGWVSPAMNIQLHYQTAGSTTLTITIESKIDTVLLVNDPSATWHFDDDSGADLNGKLRFPRAREGRYDIWVGTYSRDSGERATVLISEN